jgi:uncharacterized protein YqeY
VQVAERIRADVTAAMRAGDRNRVTALRLVLSELQKAAKEGDGDELAVLRRERKRRREAEQAYRDAGREELAAGEAFEAQAIETYLPSELSDAELDALIAAGLPVLNVANGTERNHQPDESVTLDALERTLELTLGIVAASAG